jgi:hypothetical protein
MKLLFGKQGQKVLWIPFALEQTISTSVYLHSTIMSSLLFVSSMALQMAYLDNEAELRGEYTTQQRQDRLIIVANFCFLLWFVLLSCSLASAV